LSGCAAYDEYASRYTYTSADIDRYAAVMRYNQAIYNQQVSDSLASQRDYAITQQLSQINNSIRANNAYSYTQQKQYYGQSR
jgi:predicted transcriptional regulator